MFGVLKRDWKRAMQQGPPHLPPYAQPHFQSPPYPPARPGWVGPLIVAFVVVSGIAVVAVGAIAYVILRPTHSSGGNSTTASSVFAPPPEPVTRTLFDQALAARDDQYISWNFTLHGSALVEVQVERTSGDNHFRTYLLTQDEYGRLREVDSRLLGGEFRHYPDFHVANGTELHVSGRMDPGAYVFVIQEASQPNLLRAADRVHVHVVGTATENP